MTTNQLLDKFDNVPIDSMTEELGRIRQNLITIKRKDGGLTVIKDAEIVINLLNNIES